MPSPFIEGLAPWTRRPLGVCQHTTDTIFRFRHNAVRQTGYMENALVQTKARGTGTLGTGPLCHPVHPHSAQRFQFCEAPCNDCRARSGFARA